MKRRLLNYHSISVCGPCRENIFESFVTMHLTLATRSVSVERPFPVKDLRNEEQETVNVRMIKKTNIKCNLSISICCSIVCQIYLLKLGYKVLEVTKVLIARRHVYIRRANFTAKSRFEIVKLRSFTWMNSQGSRVEKNHDSRTKSTNANNFAFKRGWVVSMLVYRNHAQEP